jgi:thiosulfate/3-mercaptopyruvate sulfurtransferase
MISAEDLKGNLDSFQVVDTMSMLEYIRGRIPGAIHISWKDFFTGSEHRPLAAEAVQSLLRRNGVDPQKPVVYYCTGGIRSGYAWLVHQLAGLSPAINFEGGTEAWDRISPKQ